MNYLSPAVVLWSGRETVIPHVECLCHFCQWSLCSHVVKWMYELSKTLRCYTLVPWKKHRSQVWCHVVFPSKKDVLTKWCKCWRKWRSFATAVHIVLLLLRVLQTGLRSSFPGIIKKSSPWCCCAVTFKLPPVTSTGRLKTGDGGHTFVSMSLVCLQPAPGEEKMQFHCAVLRLLSISRCDILLWQGIQVHVWKPACTRPLILLVSEESLA